MHFPGHEQSFADACVVLIGSGSLTIQRVWQASAERADVCRLEGRSAGSLVFATREETNMFKHLLVPTDGSALSEAAIRMAVDFAKAFDAGITGLHVIPEYHLLTYDTQMLSDTRAQYVEDAKIHAKRYVALIARAATEARVLCDTAYVVSDHPYAVITQMAEDRHCDLIVMASHGRRGVQGLLIGSETQKVLTHSKTPVLVYRGQ
jgi:nucleotide-binding universal stress UspA family protein